MKNGRGRYRVLLAGFLSTPLLFLAYASVANEPAIDLKGGFADQKAKILLELGDEKIYSEISAERRAEVVRALDRMEATLERAPSVDELDGDARVKLYNDQETVNSILTQARSDSRLVCERRAQTGSHRRTTVCATAADRARKRDASMDEMRDRLNRTTGSGPSGL